MCIRDRLERVYGNLNNVESQINTNKNKITLNITKSNLISHYNPNILFQRLVKKNKHTENLLT